MKKNQLNKGGQFIVGEEKVLNYILSILCFALFAYGFIDAVKRSFKNIDYQSFVLALALVPACLFFRKARSKRVYIRINNTGIYQDEKLITNWSNFIKAGIIQKEKTGLFNIQDNFLLKIEFKKMESQQIIKYSIPLTNTQNKSEEEVLEAVRYFLKNYRTELTK